MCLVNASVLLGWIDLGSSLCDVQSSEGKYRIMSATTLVVMSAYEKGSCKQWTNLVYKMVYVESHIVRR
jgi:hypothetical protein